MKMTDLERFMKKVEKTSSCWNWTGAKIGGKYGQFRVQGGYKLAHRFAYAILVGEIGEGKVIMHSCDNPSCVNPAHLIQGTQLENVHDMFNKGRQRYNAGAKHHNSKLTEAQVNEIRSRRNRGDKPKDIAEDLSISRSNVYMICNNHSWSAAA